MTGFRCSPEGAPKGSFFLALSLSFSLSALQGLPTKGFTKGPMRPQKSGKKNNISLNFLGWMHYFSCFFSKYKGPKNLLQKIPRPGNFGKIPLGFLQNQRFRKGVGGRGFSRTTRPLRPNAWGSKSFSPSRGLQENRFFGADVHDFRRGCP